jgi:hypothetical protein
VVLPKAEPERLQRSAAGTHCLARVRCAPSPSRRGPVRVRFVFTRSGAHARVHMLCARGASAPEARVRALSASG